MGCNPQDVESSESWEEERQRPRGGINRSAVVASPRLCPRSEGSPHHLPYPDGSVERTSGAGFLVSRSISSGLPCHRAGVSSCSLAEAPQGTSLPNGSWKAQDAKSF